MADSDAIACSFSLTNTRSYSSPLSIAHSYANACADASPVPKADSDAIAGSFSCAKAYAVFSSNIHAVTGAFSIANTGS